MIKKFEEYEKIDEGIGKDLTGLALYLLFLFNGIKGDVPKRYDMNYFQNYAKSLNIANNDFLYKSALQEAKRKVMNDPRINNKNEIIKALDSVIVFYKKDDEFCNKLLKSTNIKNSKWYASIINNKFIILDKDARPEHMYHELMHVVYELSLQKEDIVKTFNFNKPMSERLKIFNSMTNNEWIWRGGNDTNFINYIKQPTEIYARLNQLKFYLFKNKILKNSYENISPKMIYDLIYGRVYSSLSKNEQENFINQGFISLLVFVDPTKLETIK